MGAKLFKCLFACFPISLSSFTVVLVRGEVEVLKDTWPSSLTKPRAVRLYLYHLQDPNHLSNGTVPT